MTAYEDLLRTIVREQGPARHFHAGSVQFTDSYLAAALGEYDDVLPEVAFEITESIQHCLRFGPNSGYVQLFGSRSTMEAIGVGLVAGCRARLLSRFRKDLQQAARELELEEETAQPFAESAV